MNREDILKLWSSSGGDSVRGMPYDIIEEFAKRVVAAERESCAKFCEEQYEYYGHDHVFAAGIRARGQQ